MLLSYDSLKGLFENEYKDSVIGIKEQFGELTIELKSNSVYTIIKNLKEKNSFEQVMDITAVDYPEKEERFYVVYHLLSLANNLRIRLKSPLRDGDSIESISDLYKAANWWEREVFDMFGIVFTNHPDLNRILTDYGFEGHPLRKDFPTTGHVEIAYNEEKGELYYKPVDLRQKMRVFNYNNPWNNNLEQMHQEVAKSSDKK